MAPKPHDQVLEACRERQAWWAGDPDLLVDYYRGGSTGYDDVSKARTRSRTRRTRRAWDAWWGKTPSTLHPPRKLHVPVAADIGRIAASTLLSEPVTFRAAEGDKAAQQLVDDILNVDDVYSRMLVGAEAASMLSGVYGRVVWDKDVDDHTWIDYVDADRAIPEFRWGRLTGCTFWTELDHDLGDNVVLRHVEYYGKGRIEHSLYMGSRDNIGRQKPLTEHPDTQHLAEHLSDGTIVSLGVDELAVEYFPNMRPNPQWRNEPALRHLGRSDLTIDVIRLLDAMDETWSSWMRDLELGKGRMFASQEILTSLGAGKGSAFDLDQTIFSPIGTATKDGEAVSLLEAQQFDIRVDEHQRTFEGLLRQAISRVGYSPITFGLQDEVAATATEVDAKERDTNATRSAKIRLWSGLSRLATTQLRIDAHLFGGTAPAEPIEVEWPDTHQESPRAVADTVNILAQAKAASTETRVRMVNPDWDDKQVEAEVARIQDEDTAPISIMGPGESDFGADAPTDENDDDPMDELADDDEAKDAVPTPDSPAK
ncbi:phage portal protein [Gordonia insulae]|uniref:phage portal protein n=1 Tax=Gordonia insulae TaxID=2420509 RepID=UPI0013DE0D87|nr:phage portal protein [Gordonia insulae]